MDTKSEVTMASVLSDLTAVLDRVVTAQSTLFAELVRAKDAKLEIAAWNTGRPYTEYGQRIAAAQIGKTIIFFDYDRGISGEINLDNPIPPESIESETMRHYDNGLWHDTNKSVGSDAVQTLIKAAEQVPAKPGETGRKIMMARQPTPDE